MEPSFTSIPVFSYLSLLIGIISIGFGAFVLSQNFKSPLNRTYFAFCCAIATWMIPMSLLGSGQFSENTSLIFAKLVFVGVAFMAAFAFHFVIEFLGDIFKSQRSRDLRIAYGITFIFLILLWGTNEFIVGIYRYSWGNFPKGGPIHIAHTIFVMMAAFYIIYLLYKAMGLVKAKYAKNRQYYEIKYVFLSLIFVTCASSDFLHNWGVDFFPVGSIFVVLFIIFIAYAIFKHELLGISIVIQQSLVYSILISILTAVYFASVFLIGHFVGDITKTHTLSIALLISTILTIVFKPAEQYLQRILDKLIFKKPRDIIEKENLLLKNEVEKQDRLKAVATLAAGMAHEIKNPLTSIRTFAEYLPSKYDDPEFRNNFKRIVVDEVDRVNNIVKQLLEFSKPEEPNLAKERITPILDNTLELLSNNLLSNKIEVVKNYESDPPIRLDKNQLRQTFLNIFLNAIQAMPGGGRLVVSTSFANDGYLKIDVTDTGYGIPKQRLSHVFDPFFTTKDTGTGLGLSIVHGIVTKHGGKIEIKTKENSGTTMSVFLKTSV